MCRLIRFFDPFIPFIDRLSIDRLRSDNIEAGGGERCFKSSIYTGSMVRKIYEEKKKRNVEDLITDCPFLKCVKWITTIFIEPYAYTRWIRTRKKRRIYDPRIRRSVSSTCSPLWPGVAHAHTVRVTIPLSKGSCNEDRDRFLLPSRGNDRSLADISKQV